MKTIAKPIAQQWLFDESGYTAEMCITEESLHTAYQLRYKAYLHADAISPNSAEIFVDDYDGQQNARTFLIWYEGQAVASVRSFTWSAAYNWLSTPSVRIFEAEVRHHLGWEVPLLESNRYVVDPDFKGRKSLQAQMLLFRVQSIGATIDACDYVITAVRPKHVKFYERFMNFYSISDPLHTTSVSFPIQLLATPVASQEKLAQNSALANYTDADLNNYRNCLQKMELK